MDKSVSCMVRKARYADNANVRKAGNKVILSTIEAIEEITTRNRLTSYKQTILIDLTNSKKVQKACRRSDLLDACAQYNTNFARASLSLSPTGLHILSSFAFSLRDSSYALFYSVFHEALFY